MPTELRHLLFRPAEVVWAVKEYHRRTGAPLQSGSVVSCGPECDSAGGVAFRIALAPDPVDGGAVSATDPEGRLEVVVEGPTLAAALILHCRDRRIPLPAAADKSLQQFGEQVCLVAKINPKQDELPSTEELKL